MGWDERRDCGMGLKGERVSGAGSVIWRGDFGAYDRDVSFILSVE